MIAKPLYWITTILESLAANAEPDEERSLFDGSELIGEMNHRTNRMDCGLDAGGFYEEDL